MNFICLIIWSKIESYANSSNRKFIIKKNVKLMIKLFKKLDRKNLIKLFCQLSAKIKKTD